MPGEMVGMPKGRAEDDWCNEGKDLAKMEIRRQGQRGYFGGCGCPSPSLGRADLPFLLSMDLQFATLLKLWVHI